MFVKVEPSGCCERRGMVQVRLSMYLDEGDYGYEKHHIQVPVIPEGGYPGKWDAEGSPVDTKDFDKWLKKLPKVWQNNPFHNHFIQVEPDTTDEEIMDIAEAFLHEAGIKWSTNSKLDLVNDSLPFRKPKDIDAKRMKDCEDKVKHLKETILERH